MVTVIAHIHTLTHYESVWADVGYITPSSVSSGPADYQPLICLLVISAPVIFVLVII